MEAARALADLVEISSQIESAVLADPSGTVIASTFSDDERASAVARDALALLEGAAAAGQPGQLEAVLADGSVFVVRDGERLVAAVTGRQPTSGLVLYDLKACLRRSAEQPEPAPKEPAVARRKRKKAAEGDGDDGAA